ncbi:hypothetical protein [Kurthia sp. Dielmo]|uniref:hypothetical protein n=1 Tax=Kurthia sp. Dielmo TaxID=1033738 RepID=UPI0002ECE731|nr:hypothetical protein [Kurthia sp. Dielmo]
MSKKYYDAVNQLADAILINGVNFENIGAVIVDSDEKINMTIEAYEEQIKKAFEELAKFKKVVPPVSLKEKNNKLIDLIEKYVQNIAEGVENLKYRRINEAHSNIVAQLLASKEIVAHCKSFHD